MSPERYQRICEIFAAAGECPPAERELLLARECGADAELRAEIESLLAADGAAGDFIQAPALEAAAELLAAEQKESKIGRRVGPYRIVALLGAGGMGEVWLAEDARLRRRIALKLLAAAPRPEYLLRFEQEAHAVSALNHPNIITIFDIGESDGTPFIATEYVEGRTLRERLRDGTLTTAQAVEYAAQIAAALAAAHRAGIVHRDIKPENIMIRADGIVKVLDFGLARFSEKNDSNPDRKLITRPGIVMGTVSYMSPEQARALPIDERTDVFSLGIVLTEMLTGELPFPGGTEIEVLAAILEREPRPLGESFPEPLRALVGRALAKNHLDRPTAEEMQTELLAVRRKIEFSTEIINQKTARGGQNEETVALERRTAGADARGTEDFGAARSDRRPVAAGRFGGRRAAVFAAGGLLAALVAACAVYFFYFRQAPPVLGEADRLLVAEFVNRTGDEEFDDLLRQPLAVNLAQSPFLTLVTDGQIRQTLKMMEKPPDEPLTHATAREISQRRGAKAFLRGEIENYGVEYVLRLEVFSAETGEPVAREEVGAKNKDEVLPALSRAADRLRRRLGESLGTLEKFATPIQNATTASLEALRAYSLANRRLGDGKNDEAIVLLRRAVELDPNFAAAYAALGTVYYNDRQPSKAAEYAEKAFALRDRTTEREKLRIADFYYAVVSGETDRNIETLELFKQTYPRDFVTLVNLGETYSRLGNFAKAEENARAAIALDSSHFVPFSNHGRALNRLGRFAEARAVFEDMKRRGFTSPQIETGLFTAAFGLGDEAEMQAQLAALRPKQADTALLMEGNPAIFGGRWKEYVRLLSQAVAKTEQAAPDLAADYAAQVAVHGAAVGQCGAAGEWAARALRLEREQSVLTDAAFALALCGADNAALIAELKQRYPRHTVVNRMWLPLTRAAAEMTNAPERALETLEINRQFEGGAYFWDNYLRGRILLRLGRPEMARAEFEKILANRGWAVHSPLYPLAHLELSRLLAAQNDAAGAERHRAEFRRIWKNADAELLAAVGAPPG